MPQSGPSSRTERKAAYTAGRFMNGAASFPAVPPASSQEKESSRQPNKLLKLNLFRSRDKQPQPSRESLRQIDEFVNKPPPQLPAVPAVDEPTNATREPSNSSRASSQYWKGPNGMVSISHEGPGPGNDTSPPGPRPRHDGSRTSPSSPPAQLHPSDPRRHWAGNAAGHSVSSSDEASPSPYNFGRSELQFGTRQDAMQISEVSGGSNPRGSFPGAAGNTAQEAHGTSWHASPAELAESNAPRAPQPSGQRDQRVRNNRGGTDGWTEQTQHYGGPVERTAELDNDPPSRPQTGAAEARRPDRSSQRVSAYLATPIALPIDRPSSIPEDSRKRQESTKRRVEAELSGTPPEQQMSRPRWHSTPERQQPQSTPERQQQRISRRQVGSDLQEPQPSRAPKHDPRGTREAPGAKSHGRPRYAEDATEALDRFRQWSESLEADIARQKEDKARLRQEKAGLEQEKAGLEAANADLEAANSDAQERILGLKDDSRRSREEFHRALSTRDGRIATLEETLDRLEDRIAKLIREKQNDKAAYEQSLDAAELAHRTEVVHWNQQLQDADERRVAEVGREREDARKALQDAEQRRVAEGEDARKALQDAEQRRVAEGEDARKAMEKCEQEWMTQNNQLRNRMATYSTNDYIAITDPALKEAMGDVSTSLVGLCNRVARSDGLAVPERLDPSGYWARQRSSTRNWPKFVRHVCWSILLRGFFSLPLGFGVFSSDPRGHEMLMLYCRRFFGDADPHGLSTALPTGSEANHARAWNFKSIRHQVLSSEENPALVCPEADMFKRCVSAVAQELRSALLALSAGPAHSGASTLTDKMGAEISKNEISAIVTLAGKLALVAGSQRAHVLVEHCDHGTDVRGLRSRFRREGPEEKDGGGRASVVDIMLQPCLRRVGDGHADATSEQVVEMGSFLATEMGGGVGSSRGQEGGVYGAVSY